ncbi:MAG: AsnC family transcriptional regulator [Rhodobacterales bacterium]|nr:MAG: AsnC family transcriptional regulator [Rhodobacterales bacterium]
MDEIDRKLLALLKRDARAPVAELARALGLARSTVQGRIERLEARDVIAGYALRLGSGAGLGRIRATVLLSLEPRANTAVLARLRSLPEVEVAHTVSGRADLVLTLAADTTDALDRTLDRIGEIEGVKGSESLIHLSTKIRRG